MGIDLPHACWSVRIIFHSHPFYSFHLEKINLTLHEGFLQKSSLLQIENFFQDGQRGEIKGVTHPGQPELSLVLRLEEGQLGCVSVCVIIG